MAKHEKFAKKVGPGGIKCPCCVRSTKRAAQRAANRAARKLGRKACKEA